MTRALRANGAGADTEARVAELLASMTLEEKIGQLNQVNADQDPVALHGDAIRSGDVGSVINVEDPEAVRELQRIALEESPRGIPLLIGRDVIHGFSTVMPIPLGQAAAFDPALAERCARSAAIEAAAAGINWTFAPMVDISRDARWGRIAESLGEDPVLASRLASAMVDGFQGRDFTQHPPVAACAKHFAGYGVSEAGRDYATTNIPENELRNIFLPPFEACVEAGVCTLMTSFSDLDGVPASANDFLLRQILRDEWGFHGFVVSDWESIVQLAVHGIAEDDREAALLSITAGVDMDMASRAYVRFLADAVRAGVIDEGLIDRAALNVLRVKAVLGLLDGDLAIGEGFPLVRAGDGAGEAARDTAYEAALRSAVLLENPGRILPLDIDDVSRLAVIGPLADAPHDQMGTWVFDGDPGRSVTCRQAIAKCCEGRAEVDFEAALATSRSRDRSAFARARDIAAAADVALLFLGEEAILSGEAHCRADIGLPGAQEALVAEIAATGTPVVAVILAGRPLTLAPILPHCAAVLYAWHPGSQAGPAVADLLFGRAAPSGKLPVTFPRVVGQIPIYYNQKRGGKPPVEGQVVHIDDIEPLAPQTSLGMSSFHLDAGFTPQYEFGYGLSYGDFTYGNLELSADVMTVSTSLQISVTLANTGAREGEEVVQLYVCDRVGSVTRPVRELKDFQRVRLGPGESRQVTFTLCADQLRFFGRGNRRVLEAGMFDVWVGGSSSASLGSQFRLELDNR